MCLKHRKQSIIRQFPISRVFPFSSHFRAWPSACHQLAGGNTSVCLSVMMPIKSHLKRGKTRSTLYFLSSLGHLSNITSDYSQSVPNQLIKTSLMWLQCGIIWPPSLASGNFSTSLQIFTPATSSVYARRSLYHLHHRTAFLCWYLFHPCLSSSA